MKYLIGIGGGVIIGGFIFALIFDGQQSPAQAPQEDHEHEQTALFLEEAVRADGVFTVVTSFYPLAFALERIGGDKVAVENIGAGRDPHDFEPSVRDMRSLQDADLVVLQGADFEPWSDAVRDQLRAERVSVVSATAELDLRSGCHDHEEPQHEEAESEREAASVEGHHDESHHEEPHDAEPEQETHEAEPSDDHHGESTDDHGHEHGAYDPHTWLDPVLLSETVTHLAETLATLDPENATTYETNAAALRAELAALDTEYATTLAQCELSEVITSHDAFGYVGARYDFEIHAIAGLSTQDSPSAIVLAELREEAQEGVGAILLEESSVTAYGETLSRETGLQTLTINPIAFVVPADEDHLSLSRANLEAFATALQCNG